MNETEFVNQVSEQHRKGQLVLFAGAGVSMSTGLPGLNDILTRLSEEFNIQLNGNIDFSLFTQHCANKYDDKIIVKHSIRKYLVAAYEKMKKDGVITPQLLDEIRRLRFRSIWTTNYDSLLEDCHKQENLDISSIYQEKYLTTVRESKGGVVYKLHGDLADCNNIVITKSDFEEYNKPLMLTFLRRELVSNPFLFIGYSFSDHVILNQLAENRKSLEELFQKHYAILLRDNENSFEQSLFVQDLRKRYGIETLIVENGEGVTAVLSKIYRKSIANNIFISGSIHDAADISKMNFINELSKIIAYKLLDKDYNIHTGMGKGFGTVIAGYVHKYMAEHGITAWMSNNRLVVKCGEVLEENKEESESDSLRQSMWSDCECIIIFFEKDIDKDTLHDKEALGHFLSKKQLSGTHREYLLAKSQDMMIIPIRYERTECQNIFDDIKQCKCYKYLERHIDNLSSGDPNRVEASIMELLKELPQWQQEREKQERENM